MNARLYVYKYNYRYLYIKYIQQKITKLKQALLKAIFLLKILKEKEFCEYIAIEIFYISHARIQTVFAMLGIDSYAKDLIPINSESLSFSNSTKKTRGTVDEFSRNESLRQSAASERMTN